MSGLLEIQQELNRGLYNLPSQFGDRYTRDAERQLYQLLFRSFAAQRPDYLRLFFEKGEPTGPSQSWSLREAQGAKDGAEYSEAARGRACGHIFKSGESTYACKTCAIDDTCVLCTRCFESSDHEGHLVFISISPGNSGCCDCGDKEAWRRDVVCSIHSDIPDLDQHGSKDKGKVTSDHEHPQTTVPKDVVDAIRMTLSRSMDYMCDVFSCSPEQMRLAKTEKSIREDERLSRLSCSAYDVPEGPVEKAPEFALVLWNDEKHSVDDVVNQVAKACGVPRSFGREKAHEVNDVGRSIINYDTDVSKLLRQAKVIEELKLTVTIRSSRDSFREHMCATIIDWIADISGCAVGTDGALLRNIICEELLNPWRIGGSAANKGIAAQGLDDHEREDNEIERWRLRRRFIEIPAGLARNELEEVLAQNVNDFDDDDQDDEELDDLEVNDDDMEFDDEMASRDDDDMDVDRFLEEETDVTEVMEAALAGYPAPPPPPPQTVPASRRRVMTPTDSEDGETEQARPVLSAPFGEVPKTPQVTAVFKRPPRPSRHWLEKPDAFKGPRPKVPCEDLWQRVRLDWLILYDLRLWKTLRINLRHLYITTVVVIPQFKRILGLRFAGLYTPLSELYLIADREPDHSIINLSVQMLTTPTITGEVVERGNFLTNLMAILYTFLTTRQVGYPEEVNPKAVLAFDAGTVTNRRMIHFFLDLRWLFQSTYVQWRIRTEPRYLLQFLDLVKLHQGICPNVRATGEHVEYESDAWINASIIIKEIDKLCRQIAISFEPKDNDDSNQHLLRAIRHTAHVGLINSFGYERKRFQQAELKSLLDFHTVGPFTATGRFYRVPKYVVQTEAMSFHHPLHYLLSWLVENARGLDQPTARKLLTFVPADLKDPFNSIRNAPAPPSGLSSDHLLAGLLDPPLRVCAWLAQTKAGMWVRNGITLRHQANSYRSVANRDIGYQRDLLMVQIGLVLLGETEQDQGEAFLAQIIDRFQMVAWMSGDFAIVPGFEESQQLDVLEDFYHLLVIALSERGNLIPQAQQESTGPSVRMLQHDIAHALCFKPLSFSELSSRVTEKVSECDSFSDVLDSMTTFKAPEGLSDSGVFELKSEYLELIDPYYAHYNRNLREEAENVYRKHMSRKTGQKPEDVVYEPRLVPIEDGIFKDLAGFTRSELFAQIIFVAIDFAQAATTGLSGLQATRIETFLHMVLHLVQITLLEEGKASSPSFTIHATTELHRTHQGKKSCIVKALMQLAENNVYSTCHSTIKHILRKMMQYQPDRFSGLVDLAQSLDRTATDSPASLSADEREKKRREALARQARVMAQMKQQQDSFLLNQKLEGFEDEEDDDIDDAMSITHDEAKQVWHFPTGICILCQEATNDQRLFGTFTYLGESNILRTTPINDDDYVQEVIETPQNLDRPYSERPFGVAGKNKIPIKKTSLGGTITESIRQGLSKGFPQSENSFKGPVSTSCGHLMHYSCFELYFTATVRRHAQQIARHHPETPRLKEFICPLCKALGNTFLPIVWKSKDCAHDSELTSLDHITTWINKQHRDHGISSSTASNRHKEEEVLQRCKAYVAGSFMPTLVHSMEDLSMGQTPIGQSRYALRRGYSISSLFRLGRNEADPTSPLQIGSRQPTPSSSSNAEQVTNSAELVKAYARARETIVINSLSNESATDPGGFNTTGITLSQALGMTISAAEIANRGMATIQGGTILDSLSEQTITHLRILAETFESYYGVEVLRPDIGLVSARASLVEHQEVLQSMLFPSRENGGNTRRVCISSDMFLFFSDWVAFMKPDLNEAMAIMQICLWAEIVKVILAYRDWLDIQSETDVIPQDSYETAVIGLYNLSPRVRSSRLIGTPKFDASKLSQLRKMLDRYALTYLRKCLILMHIRYGFAFDNKQHPGRELDRLTQMLHIIPVQDLFELYTSVTPAGERLRSVTQYWVSHALANNRILETPIAVPHPAIFELVGLPKNYDTLTEEAIRRRCPTTGKEITDPACCVFCGAIFCSQAVCCMKKEQRGGCFQHMQTCSNGNIGIFINIRKCMVLFMNGVNGSFVQAPYLDRHGEADPTLRRHHQLYLNQKRYDKLMREIWLQHGIQSVISRKLEADINPGGWETL